MGAYPSRSSSEVAEPTLTCRSAVSAGDLAQHARIRHSVFVEEQGLFERTDQDEFDHDPTTQHVLGYAEGVPAGTVRLYRVPSPNSDEVLWKGDRLAVLSGYRHLMLGGPLVRYATAAAARAGGVVMVAFMQPANVMFFPAARLVSGSASRARLSGRAFTSGSSIDLT